MFKINKVEILIMVLLVIYSILAISLYPAMPEIIATHWNAQGVADGFSSKFWGVTILPIFFIILLAVFAMFSRTEYFDNKDMKNQLNMTIIMTMVFLFYVSILSLIYNVGIKFNMSYFIIPATAALFIALGIILRGIKQRNPFFGIRTPWTLLNQEVWEKTHKLGGWLFIILGIVTLTAVFYLQYFTIIFFIAIIAVLLITFIYSYIIYKKKKK
ncbi:MAG: SdpI family protein [archaeon]|jgi:uncharacterized membrane protein